MMPKLSKIQVTIPFLNASPRAKYRTLGGYVIEENATGSINALGWFMAKITGPLTCMFLIFEILCLLKKTVITNVK
jgi:hypothetical protein